MKCLHFLMIIMDSFIGQHNPLKYFALTIEEVMGMFSEELRELDRNTVQLMIDEMQEELNQARKELEKKEKELKQKEKEAKQKEKEEKQKEEEAEAKYQQALARIRELEAKQ